MTHSVVVIFLLSSPAVGLSVSSGVPVKVGLFIGAAPVTSATPKITVPVAPLTDNTGLFSATNRVVAICPLMVPAGALGAVGIPVSTGLALGARVVRSGNGIVDNTFATNPIVAKLL